MEIEYWWLLTLPVFFGLGWLAARVDIRQVVKESRVLPRSFLASLNYLLDERPDKAVEALKDAARVDSENVDLQLVLGSLYRRRGETEQAIRLHQDLLHRDELTAKQQKLALTALGGDYLSAGLLDRAEGVFLKLQASSQDSGAVRHLLEIYQQERDWAKAIGMARQLPDHESLHWVTEVSNFYCELASDALADSRPDIAREAITQAFGINPRCVRASMLLGELHVAEGDDVAAIAAWKTIEQFDPVYLSLIAQPLAAAYVRIGQPEPCLTLLQAWLERYPSVDLLEQVYQLQLARTGPAAAYALVREELRRNPTVLGLGKMLDAAVLMVDPVEQRADVDLMRQLVHNHTRRVARYQCRGCGFKARTFRWRCPACGGWETYPPKRNEEFDLEL